jgi:Rrf2 family protein
MKMNTKTRYGLRAMIEISKNEPSSGILQKEISKIQEIPLKYLDSIITGLRNAGLIVNYSGKRSGYILSKPPSEISVYDIYRAFEPELTLVNCACPGNECKRIDICPATDYWFDLNFHIKRMMESSSLEQISNNKQINYN